MNPRIPIEKCAYCGAETDFSQWVFGNLCCGCFYSGKDDHFRAISAASKARAMLDAAPCKSTVGFIVG